MSFFAAETRPPARPTSVFWLAESNPLVLAVEARPIARLDADVLDIRCFGSLATVLYGRDGCEHVLFSDGVHHLQLVVTMGSVLEGPVSLRSLLSGFQHIDAQILTLRRLCHLGRFGQFPRRLYPPERRAGRWLLMLRAWDGLQAGASQREIAAALFGELAVREDWSAGYLRTRVQRLIRGAEKLIGGGYRSLLR